MILTNLRILLEDATENKERLEITTHQYGTFTAVPTGIGDGDDHLDCTFEDVENWDYNGIYLKDIARVRRIGETDYAYVAEKELVEVE